MKLIDADKLIVELKNLAKGQISSCPNIAEFFVSIRVDRIIDILNSQPTAFDVDKVVSELEKSHFHTDATFDNDGCCNDDSEEVVNLNEAIEIVRRGGIDETRNI